MRTKDITLSASLMAVFILINIFSSISPIRASFLMQSALFGLFWPYFSTKLNLTFQGLRVGFNLVAFVRSAPRVLSTIRIESIAGLGVFDWAIEKFGAIIDQQQYDLVIALAKIEAGPRFWIICTSYLILACGLIPYLFYKYFKYVGVFRRLPSF